MTLYEKNLYNYIVLGILFIIYLVHRTFTEIRIRRTKFFAPFNGAHNPNQELVGKGPANKVIITVADKKLLGKILAAEDDFYWQKTRSLSPVLVAEVRAYKARRLPGTYARELLYLRDSYKVPLSKIWTVEYGVVEKVLSPQELLNDPEVKEAYQSSSQYKPRLS